MKITRDNHSCIPPFEHSEHGWQLFHVFLNVSFPFFFSFPSNEILESACCFMILNAIVLTTCLRDVKKRCKRIALGHETVHDFTRHSFIPVFCMHSRHYITLKIKRSLLPFATKVIRDNFTRLIIYHPSKYSIYIYI